MYVCNCNGLRESAVEAAFEAGARRVREVYRHHGCSAQCGKCCEDIKDCLQAMQAQSGSRVAA